MRGKIVCILLVFIMVVATVSCGNNNDTSTSGTSSPALDGDKGGATDNSRRSVTDESYSGLPEGNTSKESVGVTTENTSETANGTKPVDLEEIRRFIREQEVVLLDEGENIPHIH